MKSKLRSYVPHVHAFATKYRAAIVVSMLICLAIPLLLILIAYMVIQPNDKYVLGANSEKATKVGLVLGAGVTKDGKPYKELQARLDVAALALQEGKVRTLLLSGDNRFKDYDEPGAMRKYMIEVKHIPTNKLQVDYAGRSTYESCERAAKIFGLKQAIIISAPSHLPRAIYLCRHFGVEAYGLSSGLDANNGSRREAQARVKALFNVYVYGERTILGERIPIR